jgi:hypothetical protein
MVSEREHGRETAPQRRTVGDIQRRRSLADAAAGVQLDAADANSAAPRVGKFRVVIYLCGAPNADISGPAQACREYADAFRWEVVAEIEDRHGLGVPEGREGLKRAVELIERREAGAVLTPWRSMISPVPEEYAEVARKIEKWGAFLQVMDSDRVRARADR